MSLPIFPRLDILPPPQQRLWGELIDVPESFILYGGTAVALHLGHRESIDFDFFGTTEFDPRTLAAEIPFLRDAQITQVEPNTLSASVDRGGPVKVSFFGLPWMGQIEPPAVAQDIDLKIASLVDLAGAKASVVQARAEAKDYIDIDALITHGIDLPTALAAAIAIHGASYNPQSTLKALTYFDDGNLRNLDDGLKRRLVEAVRAVDLDRLPSLTVQVTPRNDRGWSR